MSRTTKRKQKRDVREVTSLCTARCDELAAIDRFHFLSLPVRVPSARISIMMYRWSGRKWMKKGEHRPSEIRTALLLNSRQQGSMARRAGSQTNTHVRSAALNIADGSPGGRTPEGQMPLQLDSTTSHRRCRSQSHPHGKMPPAPAAAPRASTEKMPSRLNGDEFRVRA